MSCEELLEHYELYALGLAEEPERSEIRAHLDRRCAACECGFRQALGLVAALSAAAPAAAPPARLRSRLLASVGIRELRQLSDSRLQPNIRRGSADTALGNCHL